MADLTADDDDDDVVVSTLEEALRVLGMDAAHLGRFIYGYEEIQAVAGEAEQFGLSAGVRVPITETICRLMTMGRVPNLIPDVREEPALAGLGPIQDGTIQAYAGVPVTAADGSEYGAICCISSHTEPGLTEKDLEALKELAALLGERLERDGVTPRVSAGAGPGPTQ